MQALGLLLKQPCRPLTHLLDSQPCTARALASRNFATTAQTRTISKVSCATVKQCSLQLPKTVFFRRRGGQPWQISSRLASNSRKKGLSPSREGVRPEKSLGSSHPPSKSDAKTLLRGVGPASRRSGHEPPHMKRPADDDLVYIYDVGQGRLVVWGMVAVFVAVYALGLPLPNRSSSEEASKAPPQRVVEVPKRDGGVMLAVMRPTVPALAIENLAFQVKNWPPGPTVASCAPFFTSMFAHGSIMHLGFNCEYPTLLPVAIIWHSPPTTDFFSAIFVEDGYYPFELDGRTQLTHEYQASDSTSYPNT